VTDSDTGSSPSGGSDDVGATPTAAASATTDSAVVEGSRSLGATRRGALGLLALLGAGAYATDTARAQSDHNHLTETWSADPGDPGLTIDVGSNTDRAYVGATAHPEGIAIQGVAHDPEGRNYGVEGKTKSKDGVGLLGNAINEFGTAKGLEGRTSAKHGTGVVGFAKHAEGETKGVRGLAQSPQGVGVQGINTASSGTTYGVHGRVESPDGYGLYTGDDARVDGTLTVGSGLSSDPVVIGDGASAADTGVAVGAGSAAPTEGVVIGDGTDASGNSKSTVVGQSNTLGGSGEVVVGQNNDGAPSAVTVGRNASNNQRSVAIGVDADAANRNSVAIGAFVNENASSTDESWPGIRVAIGSRASAGIRGTAVGPGAGEHGTPGSHAVNIGNEASTSADYAIAIGDQREVGSGSDDAESMIKPDADGAIALGTNVEVATAQVARIGTSTSSAPSPRQLVWQGTEQLADSEYVNEEMSLFMDESAGEFVIKGKDSDGNLREARFSWANN